MPHPSRTRDARPHGKRRIFQVALRNSPHKKASLPRMTVDHSGRLLHGELLVPERPLASGMWDFDLTIDDQEAEPLSDYVEQCWHSDKQVAYLELEILLSGGLRLQRHFLYAKKDQFLFLADAVHAPKRGLLHYCSRWPLSRGVVFRGARETTEGFLWASRRLAAVLPLALPERRNDRRQGTLRLHNGALELRQKAYARRLYAPLWIDLAPDRLGKRLTWRTLSVAEEFALQPPEIAVGYRVALAGQQWLVYRSLGPAGNRSLLGCNLTVELLVARFHRDGKAEPLIAVE